MEGNARRSIEELSAEVATNPDSTAFVELVSAYRELGDLDRAMKICLRGLARHPTHVEAHYELGCVYRARGERELALDEWAIVRSLAPEHVPARCAAADLFIEERDFEGAAFELEQGMSLAPDDRRLRALWERLQALAPGVNGAGPQPDHPGATVEPDAAAAPAPAAPAETVARDAPGTEDRPEALGWLLADAAGETIATGGSLSGEGEGREDRWRPDGLRDVRAEASRVAQYLELGAWVGMTVEGGRKRWTIMPLDEGVLVVCTDPGLPPGRAARMVERARGRAESHARGEGG